jgi:hypothetical protein
MTGVNMAIWFFSRKLLIALKRAVSRPISTSNFGNVSATGAYLILKCMPGVACHGRSFVQRRHYQLGESTCCFPGLGR